MEVYNELEKLKAENAEIRNQWHIDLNDKVAIKAENAKLKKLLKRIDEWEDDTGSMTSCEDLRGDIKQALKGESNV